MIPTHSSSQVLTTSTSTSASLEVLGREVVLQGTRVVVQDEPTILPPLDHVGKLVELTLKDEVRLGRGRGRHDH